MKVKAKDRREHQDESWDEHWGDSWDPRLGQDWREGEGKVKVRARISVRFSARSA